jgi:prepilin-type N-terminal cleavage/methylation domain-containing protein
MTIWPSHAGRSARGGFRAGSEAASRVRHALTAARRAPVPGARDGARARTVPVTPARLTAAPAAGFTLIEMLVVMTIISLLAGLTLVGVQKARQAGYENVVKADLASLKSDIEAFRNAMGDYPPSSLGDIKVKGNGINEGNESLFAFLLGRKMGGPFASDLREDRWTNLDGDELTPRQVQTVQKEIDWTRGNSQLLEYVDFWGAPFVYVHHRDYATKFKYLDAARNSFEVEARKNPATGTYYAPDSFQLWSLGLDEQNQNGEGDDIVSWR